MAVGGIPDEQLAVQVVEVCQVWPDGLKHQLDLRAKLLC